MVLNDRWNESIVLNKNKAELALKTIQKVGAVKFKNFPYNIEMQRGKEMVDNNLTVLTNYANEFKIHSYAKLSTIQEIKEFLYTVKLPVPFAINTYNGIDIDENNIIIVTEIFTSSISNRLYFRLSHSSQNIESKDLFNSFTFVDGTPFGIKDE